MTDTISYKTSSPAGDLISFLAGIKQVYEDTGKKAIVYQRLGMPGISYTDSIHPFQDEQNQPICMNQYMFDGLCPLLKSQEYIEDYLVYNGEEVQFDMDCIRLERFTNQPNGSLNRWFFYIYPDMACDLSRKWIDVPRGVMEKYDDKIVINFTARHRNHLLTYHFLKPHQEHLIFAGLKQERDMFCKTWGLDITLLEIDNFLELTKNISGCKFFMGNASFCFQLAEATKIPRLLEIFPIHPNVIPVGENAYDAYHQIPMEYFFNKLLNHERKKS